MCWMPFLSPKPTASKHWRKVKVWPQNRKSPTGLILSSSNTRLPREQELIPDARLQQATCGSKIIWLGDIPRTQWADFFTHPWLHCYFACVSVTMSESLLKERSVYFHQESSWSINERTVHWVILSGWRQCPEIPSVPWRCQLDASSPQNTCSSHCQRFFFEDLAQSAVTTEKKNAETKQKPTLVEVII